MEKFPRLSTIGPAKIARKPKISEAATPAGDGG